MKSLKKIIFLSILLILEICFTAGAQTKNGEEPEQPQKVKLEKPGYLYILNDRLYWDKKVPNTGIYVEFSGPEEDVIKTGKNPVDLSRYMKGGTAPDFRVRCIPESNDKNKYEPSDWVSQDDITVECLSGLGLEGWVSLPGKWYYFVNGKPHKGWLTIGNKEYYLDPETGVMQSGWFSKEDKWYYFSEENGEMYTDGMTPDGYFVDKGGAWDQKKPTRMKNQYPYYWY